MADAMFTLGGDLPVRRLGLGTGGLVGPGYWGPRGERGEAVALLRTAVARGVTLIDTADNYGPGLAEELIAEALYPYPEELVVATKGGVVRTGPDRWHPAGRPEELRRMCEASLRRLRVERIGLYQLHRFDPEVPVAEQLGALAELRAEGKIRHIGLDTVTAHQLATALDSVPVASVQNPFNLLDRSSAEVLALCEARGIAFLPYYPLGSGTLTSESALGSKYESEMLREAACLIKGAQENGLLSVIWMYPRGKAVINEKDSHLIAGAAGVAACLGADFVKVNAPKGEGMTSAEALREAVAAAGRTRLICAGGGSTDPNKFLSDLYDQIHIAGASGNATGRNIHQKGLDEAIRFCNAISAITIEGKSVEEAVSIFKGL